MSYLPPRLHPLIKTTVGVGEWILHVPAGTSAVSAGVIPGANGTARIDATIVTPQRGAAPGTIAADPLLIRDAWAPGDATTQKTAVIRAPIAALILVVTGAPAVFNISAQLGS